MSHVPCCKGIARWWGDRFVMPNGRLDPMCFFGVNNFVELGKVRSAKLLATFIYSTYTKHKSAKFGQHGSRYTTNDFRTTLYSALCKVGMLEVCCDFLKVRRNLSGLISGPPLVGGRRNRGRTSTALNGLLLPADGELGLGF